MANLFTMLSVIRTNRTMFLPSRNSFQVFEQFARSSLTRGMDRLEKKRLLSHSARLQAFKEFALRDSCGYVPSSPSTHRITCTNSVFDFQRALTEYKELRSQKKEITFQANQNLNSTYLHTRQKEKKRKITVNSRLHVEQAVQTKTNTCVLNESPYFTVHPVADLQPRNEITLEDVREICPILQQFPSPCNTVQNFYRVLSDELQDRSLIVEPTYKLPGKRNNLWTCSYNLKWPENIVVYVRAFTKKEAHKAAATKVLNILQSQGRISPKGLPLLSTKGTTKGTPSLQLLCTKPVIKLDQKRSLSTIPGNHLSSKATVPNNNLSFLDENQNESATDTGKLISQTPSDEPSEVTLQDITEIRPILTKFPSPKSTVHNFYTILSEELKDKSLKVEPFYKSPGKLKGLWTCFYHLKWPQNLKVSARGTSKKDASAAAAAKTIHVLQELGKISSNGLPLIYQKAEIKQLQKQKQTLVKLNSITVQCMENIVNVFNKRMKGFVEQTDQRNLSDGVDDLIYEQAGSSYGNRAPQFLGENRYYAKEQIKLPISSFKESFIELLQKNNCVIVKGEPGCGKSSRVPQYVLESWIREASSGSDFCRIAVTQPRRIAAISLSKRVASERQEENGQIVGYQVRLQSNFQRRTGRILYCTTGILLRHLQDDPKLTGFSHIILDEAHERDVNTDLLLNLLKTALVENHDLKLVVMSATIDTDKFSEYFDGAPIFGIPGFTFPIKRHFLDDSKVEYAKTLKMCSQDDPQVIHEDVAKIVSYIHKTKPEGSILVFLPGWEDLRKVERLLSSTRDSVVHLIHSKLKDSEQSRIFSKPPPGIRKIILATNIAETSITIDDVVYVVDTGMRKDSFFDFQKGINVLDMAWISKASANQRAGRAGRCSPGESFHLYTKERYEKMPDYTAPEILNTSLTKVVLDSKVFSNNMDACQFMNSLITPPEQAAVHKAVEELKQLDLLDENEKLTPLGRTLVKFQLEPCLAKAMVNSVVYKCTTPIVDIVTLFASETGIFGSVSLTDREALKKVKSQFCKTSDHLAVMRVFERWMELVEDQGTYRADRFCEENNLVPHKLDSVKKLFDLHFQYLQDGLKPIMPPSDEYSDNDELVKAVLYSGTGKVLEHRNWDIVKNRLKTNVNVLVTRNNHRATVSSESVNFKRQKFPSNFLIYIQETRSNIRRTTMVRECSLVPAISLMLFDNRDLQIEPQTEDAASDNTVVVAIKDTKLKFLCDKEQAELLMECRAAIQASYKFLINQLTCGNEEIPEFLQNWDRVLENINEILESVKLH